MTRAIIFLIIFIAIAGCATPRYIPPHERVKHPTGIYHKVKRGETVFRIAKTYNIDMDQIVKTNRLSDAGQINEGQLLFIPKRGKPMTVIPIMTDYEKEDFMWPLKGRIAAYFGTSKGRLTNKGVDIQAREGATVVAARSGWIIFSSEKVKGYGKVIVIDHTDGYQTVYLHNSENLVRAGQFVRQNTPIAKAGSTGRAKASCLHFEIRKNHNPRNPLHFLP